MGFIFIVMDDINILGEMSGMLSRFEWNCFPQVARCYVVVRRTVWQVADPFNILIYVKAGECQIESGGQTYLLRTGDLFFLPENTMYVRRPVNGELCTMVYIHFRLPGMQAFSETEAKQEALKWKQEMDDALLKEQFPVLSNGKLYFSPLMHLQPFQEEMEKIVDECLMLSSRNDVQRAMLISVGVSRLMLMASGEVIKELLEGHTQLTNEATPEKLRQAVLFIRQHESEKISLNDLCRACAVSKQQMIRYFNASFHLTPTEYIARYKINKAMELFVRGPAMSVKEVAAELGYDDQCYFSRVFARVMGESPTAFRRRALSFDESRHIAEAQQGK